MTKNLVALLCVASLGACDMCQESSAVIGVDDWDSFRCGFTAQLEVINSGTDTAVVRCVCPVEVAPTGPNPWGWGRVAAIAAAIAISAGSLLVMLLRRGPGRSIPTPG